MKVRRKLWGVLGSTVLLSSLVLAGCGSKSSAPASKKQTLNWMASASIATLDPSKASDNISDQTLYNSNQGLLVLAGTNKTAPGIAKSYQVSNKGRTYTFNLRHSKWSNGKPLTAHDFVYGFQRSVNPKTASQMAYYLGNIKGYNAITKGKASLSSLGVKAVNNYKLVVQLNKAQPYFNTLTTLPVFYAQDKAAVVKYGSKYGTASNQIVSNGPFTVTDWNGNNDKWVLRKNPYYWNAKATKLNTINYNVIKDPQTGLNEYQAGKLDYLQLNNKSQVDNFKNSGELHKRTSLSAKFLLINDKKVPAAKNLKIRRALSLVIDRAQLTKDVLGNGSIPLKGFVPAGMASYQGTDFAKAAYVPNTTDYNLKEARQLWQQGLKETGQKQVNITLLNDDDAISKSVSEFLESQLTKLPGLKVTNSQLPHATVVANVLAGKFEVSVFGWNPSLADPISPLQTKVTGNSINASKFSNPQYDKLIARSQDQDANNPAKRWADLVNAEKILLKQQGVIPLYQNKIPEVIKIKVKNVQYYPNGPVWDLSKAYLSK